MSICKPGLGYTLYQICYTMEGKLWNYYNFCENRIEKRQISIDWNENQLTRCWRNFVPSENTEYSRFEFGSFGHFFWNNITIFLSFWKSIMKIIQLLRIFTKSLNKFQNFRKLMKNFMNFFYHLKRMKGLLLFLLILRKYWQPSNSMRAELGRTGVMSLP